MSDCASFLSNLAVAPILDSCPVAGDGVNRWLFIAGKKLHRLKIQPSIIEELLEEATADCGRELKPDEIPRAVRNSAPGAKSDGSWRRKWPERNLDQIEAIGLNGMRLSELEQHSPVQLSPSENHAEEIVDHLFPADSLICAGSTVRLFLTRPREAWRGFLARQQFVVPSPMSKLKGVTQEGKLSSRSEDNVGPRHHLVVEFDFKEKDANGRDTPTGPMLRRLAEQNVTIADLCAALHAELAKLRPLALVVHSGGKSAHGWYPCAGMDEAALHRFMRYAVSIGADAATWTRVQLVRMPDGVRRNNGKRQRVLYFNPALLIGGAK